MGRKRKITYELKICNIIHLLYGLNNAYTLPDTDINPALTAPIAGKYPVECHICNSAFLDLHFGDLFYKLSLDHPDSANNSAQLLADIFGRPQNTAQHKSCWVTYADAIAMTVLHSYQADTSSFSILEDIININREILSQWNLDKFYSSVKSYVLQIQKCEKAEIKEPLNYFELEELLSLVNCYLERQDLDSYAIALTWLLLGGLLRKKIGLVLNQYKDIKDSNRKNDQIVTGSRISVNYNDCEISVMNNAFEALKHKADQGDITAQYKVGAMYFHLFNTNTESVFYDNLANAFKYLHLVADTNHELSSKAKILLARLYFNGEVPSEPQSFKKAFEYRIQSLKSNPADLICDVIFMYSNGIGHVFNFEEIVDLIETYKDYLHDRGRRIVAQFYFRYGKYEEGLEIIAESETMDATSEYTIGQVYLHGYGEKPVPNTELAEYHFMKAHELGHKTALFEIGLLYFRGTNGHKKNMAKAKESFLVTANNGLPAAQYNYAWMCKHGLGGERDLPNAIKYFLMGANAGEVLCMAELGLLYQEKEFQDYNKAFYWTQMAIEYGDNNAYLMMGNFYLLGKGCIADIDKARMYYKEAVRCGISEAKVFLDFLDSVFL